MHQNNDTNRIYDILSDRIIFGEYSSGYRLIENDLAKEFKVSRTPIRQILDKLESAGLAKHIENKGSVVRQLKVSDIRELFLIREANEGLAARLAAQNCKDRDIECLSSILKKMDTTLEKENLKDYYILCGEFHRYIFIMANNDFLFDILERIYMITSRYHIAVLSIPGRSLGSKEEHQKVLDSIATRNGDIAEKTMKEHVRQSASFYSDKNILYSLKALSKIDWHSSKN